MNVSFISFYEMTPPFNPLASLYRSDIVMAHETSARFLPNMMKRGSFLRRSYMRNHKSTLFSPKIPEREMNPCTCVH